MVEHNNVVRPSPMGFCEKVNQSCKEQATRKKTEASDFIIISRALQLCNDYHPTTKPLNQ